MRVYLPSTLPDLAAALDAGVVSGDTAYAVTPSLREWYTEGDLEELEYAATTAAARESLRLLADAAVPPRRVVIAADVADNAAQPVPAMGRAAVHLTSPVQLSDVVSAHVDDSAAQDDVRRAVAALAAADLGDEDAQFTVDGVEDHELAWYAAQELNALVELEG
ncbi:MAG: DUF6912 family protein [Actinomycetes bacterium]